MDEKKKKQEKNLNWAELDHSKDRNVPLHLLTTNIAMRIKVKQLLRKNWFKISCFQIWH